MRIPRSRHPFRDLGLRFLASKEMEQPLPEPRVVAEGTYLYDGIVECDLRIMFAPMRYGTGDYEDPPEIADDVEAPTYYLEFGSTSERGHFNARSGGYDSLAEAMAAAGSAPGIGSTVRWFVVPGTDAQK